MQAETNLLQKETDKVLLKGAPSVCATSQEYQKIVKYFEILARIDKKLKKKANERNNQGNTNTTSKTR
jgi:hypothetical protein